MLENESAHGRVTFGKIVHKACEKSDFRDAVENGVLFSLRLVPSMSEMALSSASRAAVARLHGVSRSTDLLEVRDGEPLAQILDSFRDAPPDQ